MNPIPTRNAAAGRGRWALFGAAATVLVVAAIASFALAEEPAADAPPAPPRTALADTPKDTLTAAGQEALRSGGLLRHHTPSPLIIPDQTIPLRFSHRLHVTELECIDCHTEVEGSIRASDNNLPEEEGCFDCHDVDEGMSDPPGDPPATCDTCHPGFEATFPEDVDDFTQTHRSTVHPPAVDLPPPNLKFNHKIHVTRRGDGEKDAPIPCAICHGDLADVDYADRENALPVMGTCLECHSGPRDAPDECRTCHLTKPDGRVDVDAAHQKLKPEGWYMGDAHDDNFLQNHKYAAKMNDGYCASCHAPRFCTDCHNGVSKPLTFHPNNWILTHPTAARKNTPECSSCHRAQTFCVNCHQQTKVVWENGGQQELRQQGLRFHPEGWVDDRYTQGIKARGPNHHAFQAQRNIRACASCHTEETCLTCHAPGFGPLAVNPHPPGFAGSGLCKRQLKRNHRACVKCHELGSAAIMMCR